MNFAYLWVAIGGALGSVGPLLDQRHASRATSARPSRGARCIINVTGSFVIGVIAALADARKAGWIPRRARLPRNFS